MVEVVEILFESKSLWTKFILSFYLAIMFQGTFWFFVSWNRQVLCVESAVVIAIEAKVDCLPIIQHSVFSLI